MSAAELVEHFFRHEYGRLVASLSRRVGVEQLEAVEDAAQFALARALERWPLDGQPEAPAAWLSRVAHNHLIGELRKQAGRRRLLHAHAQGLGARDEPPPAAALAGELRDDLLRMLFVCCDDGLPPASQLALALKTLCGFGVGEIAQRLFTSEANVYKRLARARVRLREQPPQLDGLELGQLRARLPSVHRVLYPVHRGAPLGPRRARHPRGAVRRGPAPRARARRAPRG